MLVLVKVLVRKEHFNQGGASQSCGGHDLTTSSFLRGLQPLLDNTERDRLRLASTLTAKVATPVQTDISASWFASWARKSCFSFRLIGLDAVFAQCSCAFVLCSFAQEKLNWPPVLGSSSVFFCSFTKEISPLWDQIKVFLFLFYSRVSGYHAAPSVRQRVSCVFPKGRPSAAPWLAEPVAILLGCFPLEPDCREHAVLQSR